ncbi:MAG TPA: hypothetical protein DCQ98_18520 [Planctomycetaceae bacterium]|nr:hypothetical protein [Planctomycetaceae bacterium]HRE99654.1 hypothetical protein [Pirellulaceae bacterium]
MKNLLSVLPFVALTVFCWGVYGPVLHEGQHLMGVEKQPSSLRPLICVGIAYFIIAVIFPLIVLRTKGEKGNWTTSGFVWSLGAGAAGALGALGIVLAFKFKGAPVYVMPLVFGLAPVVNTFVTMLMSRTLKQASIPFYACVATVAIGAAGVMYFKPTAPKGAAEKPSVAETSESAESASEASDKVATASTSAAGPNYLMVSLFIGLTAVSWGAYGPVLHKGQMKMNGSRLRPLLCVGLAYFAIAVVVPVLLMPSFPEPGPDPYGWPPLGVLWSLGGGAAGAFGAIGIIYAFNFGGKPIFVMPLVFGCAPVVNTFISTIGAGTYAYIGMPFVVSLLLVVSGAVGVLVFAPRGPHKPSPNAPAH